LAAPFFGLTEPVPRSPLGNFLVEQATKGVASLTAAVLVDAIGGSTELVPLESSDPPSSSSDGGAGERSESSVAVPVRALQTVVADVDAVVVLESELVDVEGVGMSGVAGLSGGGDGDVNSRPAAQRRSKLVSPFFLSFFVR